MKKIGIYGLNQTIQKELLTEVTLEDDGHVVFSNNHPIAERLQNDGVYDRVAKQFYPISQPEQFMKALLKEYSRGEIWAEKLIWR